MRRKRSSTPRRLGLAAVTAALAAAIAAAGARLARRDDLPDAARRLGDRFGRKPAAATFTCQCGQKYRVSGVDRHRVYWPAGAAEDAPVLGDACIACETPLPAGHDTGVAA
jgi:hypothetical protein